MKNALRLYWNGWYLIGFSIMKFAQEQNRKTWNESVQKTD